MHVKTSLFAAATLLGIVAAAGLPAGPALAAALPDVALNGAFTKASYDVGEHFTLAVTATNHGTVPATGVQITGGDSDGVDAVDYGLLATGFNLAPGETKVVNITGVTTALGQKYGRAAILFDAAATEGDAKPEDNHFGAHAAIPGAFGGLKGLIYPGDTVSSTPVPGQPGVAGVRVTAWSEDPPVFLDTTTDASGRFNFGTLPAGIVTLSFIQRGRP